MKTEVKDIMTTRVIWVKKDATFREMAVALRKHRVSAFPVVDEDGMVIGLVSEADLLTKEALDGESGVFSSLLHRRDQAKARGVTAGDLMTAAVVAVRPDDTVEYAAKLMYDRRVKRLPVTDAAGPGTGIFLDVRLSRLVAAADDAIAAAQAGDFTQLRRHLPRFETLTSAIWAVQEVSRQPDRTPRRTR
jgi:predicted transcriptional regulator